MLVPDPVLVVTRESECVCFELIAACAFASEKNCDPYEKIHPERCIPLRGETHALKFLHFQRIFVTFAGAF